MNLDESPCKHCKEKNLPKCAETCKILDAYQKQLIYYLSMGKYVSDKEEFSILYNTRRSHNARS